MESAGGMKFPLMGTGVVYQMFRTLDAMDMQEKGTQAIIAAVEKLAEAKLVD